MARKSVKIRDFQAAVAALAVLFLLSSQAFAGGTSTVSTTPGTGAGIIDSITDKTAVSTGGGAASVKARVEFRQAASYSVAHDPIDLTKATQAIDLDHIVTNEAHITIGTLKGETVLMTCGVTGVADHAAYTRDCDGTPSVKNHPVAAGKSIDDNILLTKDLLPTTSGVSDGSVSIQVTYP